MRAYMPIILVLLAVFTASCIAYVAWALSSGEAGPQAEDDSAADSDAGAGPETDN